MEEGQDLLQQLRVVPFVLRKYRKAQLIRSGKEFQAFASAAYGEEGLGEHLLGGEQGLGQHHRLLVATVLSRLGLFAALVQFDQPLLAPDELLARLRPSISID